MGRELEGYRDNIAQLNRLFPDYEMLSLKEVMQVLNYSDPRSVKKFLGRKFVNGKLSKTALARYMSGGK